MSTWREIKKIINDNTHFLLTTHINPDGDGIGSATALIELLLTLRKKVVFTCDSIIPEKFHFLNFHGLHREYQEAEVFFPLEVVIVLDTFRKERIGRVAEILENPHILTLCIDHHCTDCSFAHHAIIDSHACSVGAMIYTLFKEYGVELNFQAAQGIYTSIIMDTGRFSYGSTSREAHLIADECIKMGVDPSGMYAQLFQQVPLKQMKIFLNALKKMETHFNNRILLQQIHFADYKELTSEIDVGLLQDFDTIHEFNKSIKGVDCSAILWELPDGTVRASLRSNSNMDIVQPMKQLGGGGHPNAAGAHLFFSMEESRRIVLDLLKTHLILC